MDSENVSYSRVWPFVWFVLSIIYLVSPVDLIPDVPIIGQIDDFFVTAIGTLNLVQKTCYKTMSTLSSIAKILKWILIVLAIMIIPLLIIAGKVVVGWFS
jgi:uncharacterized membrane protein YkvA (DUF1232 family)